MQNSIRDAAEWQKKKDYRIFQNTDRYTYPEATRIMLVSQGENHFVPIFQNQLNKEEKSNKDHKLVLLIIYSDETNWIKIMLSKKNLYDKIKQIIT